MIQIEKLSFCYKDSKEKVLDNISLTIPDADFLGVIGKSGAGKTTFSYALNGVIPHYYKGDYYGKVLVNGKDVFETDPCQLALEVGSVFQDIESQITNSIVEDEILFGLENFAFEKNEIFSRLEWAMNATGITNLRDREISSLSGGQKQKVAITAILALKPKIILFDEPTGELDPEASENIFRILTELNKNLGMTIIVIEQKTKLLKKYAKRIIQIQDGKVTEAAK